MVADMVNQNQKL